MTGCPKTAAGRVRSSWPSSDRQSGCDDAIFDPGGLARGPAGSAATAAEALPPRPPPPVQGEPGTRGSVGSERRVTFRQTPFHRPGAAAGLREVASALLGGTAVEREDDQPRRSATAWGSRITGYSPGGRSRGFADVSAFSPPARPARRRRRRPAAAGVDRGVARARAVGRAHRGRVAGRGRAMETEIPLRVGNRRPAGAGLEEARCVEPAATCPLKGDLHAAAADDRAGVGRGRIKGGDGRIFLGTERVDRLGIGPGAASAGLRSARPPRAGRRRRACRP